MTMTKTLTNEKERDTNLIYIPRLQPKNDNCNASFYDYDYDGNNGDIRHRRGSQEYEVYTPDVRPDPDDARHIYVGDTPTYDVRPDDDVIPEYEATGHVPSQLGPQQAEQLLAYSAGGSTLALRTHIERSLRAPSVDTACENYLIALRYSLGQEVVDDLLQFIRDNFSIVSETQGFLGLPMHIAMVFLRDNHLRVNTELDIYVAALQWIDYNKQERLDAASEIMRCVRFTYLSPEDIIKFVEPNTSLFVGEKGKETLVSIYRTHMLILAGLQKNVGEPPRNYLKPPDFPIKGSVYFRPDDDMDKRLAEFHFDIKSSMMKGASEKPRFEIQGGDYETELEDDDDDYPLPSNEYGNLYNKDEENEEQLSQNNTSISGQYEIREPPKYQSIFETYVDNQRRDVKQKCGRKETQDTKNTSNRVQSKRDKVDDCRSRNAYAYQQKLRSPSQICEPTKQTAQFSKYLEQQQIETAQKLSTLPNAQKCIQASTSQGNSFDNVFARYLNFQESQASRLDDLHNTDQECHRVCCEAESKVTTTDNENSSQNKDVDTEQQLQHKSRKLISERIKDYRFSLLRPLTLREEELSSHSSSRQSSQDRPRTKRKSQAKVRFSEDASESETSTEVIIPQVQYPKERDSRKVHHIDIVDDIATDVRSFYPTAATSHRNQDFHHHVKSNIQNNKLTPTEQTYQRASSNNDSGMLQKHGNANTQNNHLNQVEYSQQIVGANRQTIQNNQPYSTMPGVSLTDGTQTVPFGQMRGGLNMHADSQFRPIRPLYAPIQGMKSSDIPTPRQIDSFSRENRSALVIERKENPNNLAENEPSKNVISIRWKPVPKPSLKENSNKKASQERRKVSFELDLSKSDETDSKNESIH